MTMLRDDGCASGGHLFDAKEFGALGDGVSLDTAAIQRALDACAGRGGGTVLLRPGIFLSGGLRLRDKVNLRIEAGATLLGSPNPDDYFTDENQRYAHGIIGKVLVYAEGCDAVGISGEGTIDGNGGRFERKMSASRPVLVRFRDCTGVSLRDVSLRDGASWAVHTIGCRQVRLENLDIHSVLHQTTDGLDIDGCEDVFVRGCSIVTGDDAIALKATQPGRPCRDVTVSDCHLSSYCQAIRVGPETMADICRVSVGNCVIRDTGMGGICVQAAHGGAVRDLVFHGIVMDMVSNPISVRLGGWRDGDENVQPWFLDDSRWQEGRLSDVLFANIRARVPSRYLEGTPKESRTFKENERTCITVTGTTATRPKRIVFDQVDVTFPGGGTAADATRAIPELDRQYPAPFMFGVPPVYGLLARHVDDLVFKDVRFRLASPDARPAVMCEDVTDADLAGLRADSSITDTGGVTQ